MKYSILDTLCLHDNPRNYQYLRWCNKRALDWLQEYIDRREALECARTEIALGDHLLDMGETDPEEDPDDGEF